LDYTGRKSREGDGVMLDASRAVIEGSILSIVFLVMVLSTLAYNPRMWLQDYPKDIQKIAPPQTVNDKRQFKMVGLSMLVIALAPLVVSILFDGNQITFWQTFLHFYVVFMMVSGLADLIILDWLVFCLITPKFIVIPGTEGAKGYKNYLYHFIAFLKGAIIMGVLSLILTGLRMAATLL
jgi:hypothetical protein